MRKLSEACARNSNRKTHESSTPRSRSTSTSSFRNACERKAECLAHTSKGQYTPRAEAAEREENRGKTKCVAQHAKNDDRRPPSSQQHTGLSLHTDTAHGSARKHTRREITRRTREKKNLRPNSAHIAHDRRSAHERASQECMKCDGKGTATLL